MKLTMVQKKEQIKKIRNDICKNCHAEMGMDEKDPCFGCLYKKLMDEIMED
jgi:hypothetical protein